MVKVRETHSFAADGSVNVEHWLAVLPVSVEASERESLARACAVLNDSASTFPLNSKERNFLLGGLEMAHILADLQLDSESIIAALLYRLVKQDLLTIKSVKDQFGGKEAKLLEGVQRMAAVAAEHASLESGFGQQYDQTTNVRRMLVAMVDDVRVALIKLAERTCTIREIKEEDPETKRKIAKEVSEIYAPLADRLGIGQIKWELEDIAFRYLHSEPYMSIARQLDERRLDRQQYIDRVKSELQAAMDDAEIHVDLAGRAKHIYSIWKKMQRKGVGFSRIYDIRAVRLLVDEVKDCYTALGVVHSLWRNIPHEFDDYIAAPKHNGYRSLHTAVIGPEGKVLEVQIRTRDMHEEAERGVCSHWSYKGTDSAVRQHEAYEEKIGWLRQVLDWHDELGDSEHIKAGFSHELSQERIYVFTPDGHVVDLTAGATPVDFAYHIHTEVGHRCRGAKINGKIVPLTYTLQTGEQVEVLTGGEPAPSRDWLRADLAYIKTSRARAKIQHWFKEQARDENVVAGRALLEREFKRLALTSLDYKLVADKVNYKAVEDMYAAVGAGDLSSGQVMTAAQHLIVADAELRAPKAFRARYPRQEPRMDEVTISGIGNLLSHLAGCCKPVPGDAITGYITLGRGVTIHRQDCGKVLQLQKEDPNRIITVEWGGEPQQTYPCDIVIEAFDRPGLLRDITVLLANEKTNLVAAQTDTDLDTNMATMTISVATTGLDPLARLLAKLSGIPNVVRVRRKAEGANESR